MNNIFEGLFILLIVTICSTLITLIVDTIIKIKIKYKEYELNKYITNITTNLDTDIEQIIDKFIETRFDHYLILNVEYQNVPFIDSKLEEKITREVCHDVIDTISPVILTKLSTIYKESKIIDIISEKVYIKMMEYSLSYNNKESK